MSAIERKMSSHAAVSGSFGATARGNVRDANEDRFLVNEEQGLFVVSDGIGGHPGGDVAAERVVNALPGEVAAAFKASSPMNDRAAAGLVAGVLARVNGRVRRKSRDMDGMDGMGATVVACLVRKGFVVIGHMGDSRAYLLRNGCLERLTRDQTVTELLVQLGRIPRKEAKRHFGKNSLTCYMGMPGEPDPAVGTLQLKPGDRLLLCSDGLTHELRDREIGKVLWDGDDPRRCAGELVKAAVAAGGRDNVTAVVVQMGEHERRLQKGKLGIVVRRDIGKSLRNWE